MTSEQSNKTPDPASNASRWLPLLLILLWLAMVLAVWPAGEFPLNDDWSYARAVETLVDHGQFKLTGWTSMPVIAQIIWGTIFCLPFGFSFIALRISTLILGVIGILASYAFAVEAGTSRRIAFFSVLILAVNPIYFQLANTFMTDVPFLAVAVTSLFLLARGMRTSKRSWLIAGIIVATIATLIRQAGLIIPLAFSISWFLQANTSFRRNNSWLPVLAIATVFGSVFTYERILLLGGNVPALYHEKNFDLIVRAMAPMSNLGFWTLNILAASAYLGLFLLPFLLILPNEKSTESRKIKRLIFLLSTVITILLYFNDTLMPFLGNVLFDMGLGPVRLHDISTLKLAHWPALPVLMKLLITFLAVLGAGLILARFISSFYRATPSQLHNPTNPAILLATSTAILYILPIVVGGLYDRYLIFLIPLVGILTAATTSQAKELSSFSRTSTAIFVMFCLLLFSVAATHDYFSWNRARWDAVNELTTGQNISWTKIDGGFEFNGWYGYDVNHPRGYPENKAKSWWWVKDDEYIIALGPIPGYSKEKEYPFDRLIPPGHGSVLVLHRDLMRTR
ncbi:MAG: glycosyltransferase family 39 protein [Kiritimatiellae bacterium]|nr:glycosyltransferase family 39 protein [Kiritimatiellia bacterium]